MSNKEITLRKKQYNPQVDNGGGVVIFDTQTKRILVSGKEYGHFATMNASGSITENSTAQEFPTAAAVYNYVTQTLEDYNTFTIAYANELISQGVITPISSVPSMVYAPEVILNTESESVTINTLKENAVYIYRQPLTQLNIMSALISPLETTIYFTTHETSNFSYVFPQGLKKATTIKFDKNSNYCISLKDGVIVLEKIEKYLDESTFIFSSEQLRDSVLKAQPDIVENASSTPVITNTQPYTIYKFGEVTSLTMQNIPANTLETVIYFSVGSVPLTNLTLSGQSSLKLSSGSITSFSQGQFCIAIKDGVVVITELKNY